MARESREVMLRGMCGTKLSVLDFLPISGAQSGESTQRKAR